MQVTGNSSSIVGANIRVTISLTGIPHHDTTKRFVGLDAINSGSQGIIGNITRRGCSGRAGNSEVDLDIWIFGLCRSPIIPGIKVEGTLDRAIVVVELNPDEIKPCVIECVPEVCIREWALRSTSDIVILGAVRSCKQVVRQVPTLILRISDQVLTIMGSKLLNHSSISSCRASLNIEIKAINNSISEWTSRAVASTKGVPQSVSKSSSLRVRGKTIGAGGTTESQDNFFTLSLAGLDICKKSQSAIK